MSTTTPSKPRPLQDAREHEHQIEQHPRQVEDRNRAGWPELTNGIDIGSCVASVVEAP
jgi:hypothetical protein